MTNPRSSDPSDLRPRGLRVWFPEAETALYRALAAAAARGLGGLGFVRAVYARRSVACGEVVLGRSDLDLHVIIASFDDPVAEGRALALLVQRARALRRVLPILGDLDVSTAEDLARWYRNRPGYWHRDRGWLRLWGDVVERPEPDASDPELRDSLVRWFALSALRLPEQVRGRSVHHCVNLVIDLLHAHALICAGAGRGWLGRGAGSAALRRGDVLERWRRADADDPRRARLSDGYASAFRLGASRDLVVVAQALALELGESLAAELGLSGGDEAVARELQARPPFEFAPRRYLLPDPSSAADVARALDELTRDPRVVVTTRGSLALLLRYFRPWEWAGLARANLRLGLPEPREEDYLAAVRCSLHPEFPRAAAFRPGTGVAIGLRLAQCRAYLEEGRVGALRDDLAGVYEAVYGRPPGCEPPAGDDYFVRHYPASVRLIRELCDHPRLR